MKYLNLTAIIAVTCLAVTPAFARYYYPAPRAYGYPMAPSPYTGYFSVDLGAGTLATPDKNLVDPSGAYITDASHDNTYLAGGLSTGFRGAINPILSLGGEFGYGYDGQAKYTEEVAYDSSGTARISSQDFNLLGTGMLHFRNGFNIFGKAGGAYVIQKLHVTGQALGEDLGDYNTSINGFKPMVATGIGYQLRMVNIYAQYSHIFGSNPDNFSDFISPTDGTLTQIVSVDTFKVGLAFNLRI